MPFEPPCFAPEFFFNTDILSIIKNVMGDRIVADQWGCDVPLTGSTYQDIHIDYKRPLFPEVQDLLLPTYMMVVSFGLNEITEKNGAIELAAGTHKIPRYQACNDIENGRIKMQSISMNIGDVLIRHPWTWHRGTPNKTDVPRLLVTIRYVRSWYWDNSREVNAIPPGVYTSLTPEQQGMLRFPIRNT
jgi:ectoine hydroxylase-related dioxygenase (phytanoyl-CoA dioxygenase family)